MANVKSITERQGFWELPEAAQVIVLKRGSMEFANLDPEVQTAVFNKLKTARAEQPQQKEDLGLLGRIGENLFKSGQEFEQYASNRWNRQPIVQGQEVAPDQMRRDLGMAERTDPLAKYKQKAGAAIDIGISAGANLLKGLGEGVIGEIVGTGASEAFKRLPEWYQKDAMFTLNELMNSDTGKAGLKMYAKYGELKEDWVKDNPDDAERIKLMAGLLGFTGTKRLSEIFGTKLGNELKDVTEYGIKKYVADVPEAMGEFKPRPETPKWSGSAKSKDLIKEYGEGAKGAVNYGITKGIRPSVSGKRQWGFIQDYNDKAYSAVKSVINRTPELPKNLDEFAQSLQTSKRQIWDQVKTISKNAKKAKVDLDPAMKSMRKMADDLMAGPNRKQAEYIDETIKSWIQQFPTGKITPERAEKLLSEFNAAASAFYKNPNLNDASKALVDAGIGDEIREALFRSIPDSKTYKALRKEYGGILAIERDVTRRAIVDSRKNAKGFFDLLGDWGTAEFATGLATMNPQMVAKGFIQKAVTKVTKLKNDPNRIIKNMFEDAEREMVRAGEIGPKNPYVKGQRLPLKKELTPAPTKGFDVSRKLEPNAAQKKTLDFINAARAKQGLPPIEKISGYKW